MTAPAIQITLPPFIRALLEIQQQTRDYRHLTQVVQDYFTLWSLGAENISLPKALERLEALKESWEADLALKATNPDHEISPQAERYGEILELSKRSKDVTFSAQTCSVIEDFAALCDQDAGRIASQILIGFMFRPTQRRILLDDALPDELHGKAASKAAREALNVKVVHEDDWVYIKAGDEPLNPDDLGSLSNVCLRANPSDSNKLWWAGQALN